MNILLEPAFVLHTRPYRETSLIIDFFCLNQGRVTALARSARGYKSRLKGCLVPFSPLLITCVGKTDLLTLTNAETIGPTYFPQGQNLFGGLYLNELLVKLLQKCDPHPKLFYSYNKALMQLELEQKTLNQIPLRLFEKELLSELGYGLELNKEVSGNPVVPQQSYVYRIEKGLVACTENHNETLVFSGDSLLAISENRFDTVKILKDARRLMRYILSTLLGNQVLRSRELFL